MKATSIFMKFFGRKPGQTLVQFAAEIKALGADEKAELAKLAAKELGVEYDAPAPTAGTQGVV